VRRTKHAFILMALPAFAYKPQNKIKSVMMMMIMVISQMVQDISRGERNSRNRKSHYISNMGLCGVLAPQTVVELPRLRVSPVENCYTIDISSTRRSGLCKSIVCNDWMIKRHEPTSGLAAEIRVYSTAKCRPLTELKAIIHFPIAFIFTGRILNIQPGLYRPIFTGTKKMLINTYEQKGSVFY